MKYNQYEMSLNTVSTQILKHLHKNKHDRKKMGMMGAMRHLIKNYARDLFTHMDGAIFAEEYFWLKNRHMIFPESINTLENLSKGKFQVELADGIIMPHESFIMNFPKGFKLAGKEASGILVTSSCVDERCEKIFRPFMQAVDHPAKDRQLNADSGWDGAAGGKFLSVNYSMEKINGAPVMSRVTIPWHKLPQALSSKTANEYRAVIGDYNNDGDPLSFTLSDDENEYQFELIKLLAKMCVYIQATGCLIEGFPSEYTYDAPLYIKEAPKPSRFSVAGGISPVEQKTAHYRSFFIRQLRHDRYYKDDEWKDKPRGSRYVFVKDTYVNLDINAETIVDDADVI